MSLIEYTLFGKIDKVENALEFIRLQAPDDEKSWVAFSGGKDSVVIEHLMKISEKPYEAHFSITTVDPPEVCAFIRKEYPYVKIDMPKTSMYKLIVEHVMPPTRKVRYCCEHLKEQGGKGRFVVLGLRWAESAKRSKRRPTEICTKTGTRTINPIISWSNEEVWEYIRSRKLPYCKLYDEGWKRIGCVMCPQQDGRLQRRDAKKYPGIYKLYLRAFTTMLSNRRYKGLETKWQTAEEVFEWWVTKKPKYKDPNQCYMFDN